MMAIRLTLRTRKRFRYLLFVACVGFSGLFLLALLRCPPGGCLIRSGPVVRTFPEREWRNTTHKTILRWTGFFGDETWENSDDRYLRGCKVSTCKLTNDKEQLDNADAVLFHVGAVFNFWKGITWPARRRPDQVWVLHNVEPPPRVPLNMESLAGLFNWTAWYRFDSDVPVTYGGYKTKFENSSHNFAVERPRLVAWMSSNCYDFARRMLIIRELKNYLPLELFGKCGGRRCPETICSDTISVYKFFFTMENCICKDYVTEKFWEALRRKQVPVVMGGARYKKLAPPHSFVDISDFKDLKSLADYLINVGNNDEEYNKYLEWTKSYDIYGELEARRIFWCDLCEALHDKSRPAQVYDDLNGWFAENPETCPQWNVSTIIVLKRKY